MSLANPLALLYQIKQEYLSFLDFDFQVHVCVFNPFSDLFDQEGSLSRIKAELVFCFCSIGSSSASWASDLGLQSGQPYAWAGLEVLMTLVPACCSFWLSFTVWVYLLLWAWRLPPLWQARTRPFWLVVPPSASRPGWTPTYLLLAPSVPFWTISALNQWHSVH